MCTRPGYCTGQVRLLQHTLQRHFSDTQINTFVLCNAWRTVETGNWVASWLLSCPLEPVAAVYVFVFDSKGRLLIQKRSANKKIGPNQWDLSVAEHLSAGERSARASAVPMGLQCLSLEGWQAQKMQLSTHCTATGQVSKALQSTLQQPIMQEPLMCCYVTQPQ